MDTVAAASSTPLTQTAEPDYLDMKNAMRGCYRHSVVKLIRGILLFPVMVQTERDGLMKKINRGHVAHAYYMKELDMFETKQGFYASAGFNLFWQEQVKPLFGGHDFVTRGALLSTKKLEANTRSVRPITPSQLDDLIWKSASGLKSCFKDLQGIAALHLDRGGAIPIGRQLPEILDLVKRSIWRKDNPSQCPRGENRDVERDLAEEDVDRDVAEEDAERDLTEEERSPKPGYFPNHFLVWVLYSALGIDRYGSPMHSFDERVEVQMLARISRASQRAAKSSKNCIQEEKRGELLDRITQLIEAKKREVDFSRKERDDAMQRKDAYRREKLQSQRQGEQLRFYQTMITSKDTLIAALASQASNPEILKLMLDAEAIKKDMLLKCEDIIKTSASVSASFVEEEMATPPLPAAVELEEVQMIGESKRRRRTAEEVAQSALDAARVQVPKADMSAQFD